MSYEIENYRKKYSSSIRVPKVVNDQLREVLFRPIVTGAERRKEIIRLRELIKTPQAKLEALERVTK